MSGQKKDNASKVMLEGEEMDEQVKKAIDSADESQVYEIIMAAQERLKDVKREYAKNATLGQMVQYGNGRKGKIVQINMEGVIVQPEDGERKKKLKWTEIERLL